MRRLLLRALLTAVAMACMLTFYWMSQSNMERWISRSANDNELQTHITSFYKNPTPNPTISTKRTATFRGTRSPKNKNSRILFYNRVPKCGSRSFLNVMKSVASKNNFSVSIAEGYPNPHQNHDEVLREMKKIAKLKPNAFYARHVHFLDFQEHGYQTPTYINMIRDPVARFVSQYNYLKYGDNSRSAHGINSSNWSDVNHCILNEEKRCRSPFYKFCYIRYFCGFHPSCTNSKSPENIKLAKKHIDEDYFVIGMTEEFDNTVMLLEKALPTFFKGSYESWKGIKSSMKSKTKTRTQEFLSEEAYEKLRYDILSDEYQVYEYAKAKYERLKVKYGV